MGLNEDLERIAQQERELQLPRLDAQTAWELGSRLRTMAAERGTRRRDRRAPLRPAAVLCGHGRHHSRQRGMGAPQEQRGGAIPSQFVRRRTERETQKRDPG